MNNTKKDYKGLKQKIGSFFAILSLITYIALLITCYVFITTILLLPLVVIGPILIIGLLHKNKKLLIIRCKATCWALGVFILLLFPAFWLIPQQMYVRMNRMNELITPNAPAVIQFAGEFLAETPEYDTLSFEEKAERATAFTMREIVWRLDYENYGMAGHVATPTQCIELRSDDCQGQAVTLASLLLYLGFPYVWVVETPFHWYVLVRDPALGALASGWEANVEYYQESGDLLPLNRDGRGNMPEWRFEEILLIFNHEEILFPVNPFKAIFIGWSATAFFNQELLPLFLTYEIVYIFLAMLALAIPITGWTSYMSSFKGEKREKISEPKGKKAKKFLLRIGILTGLLFGVFLLWFFLQPIIWDYTLIFSISEIALICTLASEPKFWRIFRLD